MEEQALGIVLQSRPLTESSLVVHWLTLDQGRVATVAKGARRPKSPFLGKLDLFHEVEIAFVRSRRSELHTLREAVIRHTFAPIRKDIDLLRQAAYAAQLMQTAAEPDTPAPELYPLLRWFLERLHTAGSAPWHAMRLEWRLLECLGYGPDPGHPLAKSLDPETLGAWLAAEEDWKITEAKSRPFGKNLGRFLAAQLSDAFGKLPRLRPEVVPF